MNMVMINVAERGKACFICFAVFLIFLANLWHTSIDESLFIQ